MKPNLGERDLRKMEQTYADICSQLFKAKARLYQLALEGLETGGRDELLGLTETLDSVIEQAANPKLSAASRRWSRTELPNLVDAIEHGMTERDYLEFESARSWLDRQTKGGVP